MIGYLFVFAVERPVAGTLSLMATLGALAFVMGAVGYGNGTLARGLFLGVIGLAAGLALGITAARRVKRPPD